MAFALNAEIKPLEAVKYLNEIITKICPRNVYAT